MISKVGFKTFLNITPGVTFPTPGSSTQPTEIPGMTGPTEFILTFDENPLAEFAELPLDAMGPKYAKAAQDKKLANWDAKEVGGQADGLWFSNILCGVVRGSLEMVRVSPPPSSPAPASAPRPPIRRANRNLSSSKCRSRRPSSRIDCAGTTRRMYTSS